MEDHRKDLIQKATQKEPTSATNDRLQKMIRIWDSDTNNMNKIRIQD